jgi:hypothetical protein
VTYSPGVVHPGDTPAPAEETTVAKATTAIEPTSVAEVDDWVIGTWHVYYHIELHCVVERDGTPWLDACPSATIQDWYRWHSYHAAKKFQREHPTLEGYVICNLSEMRRQCRTRRAIDDAKTT